MSFFDFYQRLQAKLHAGEKLVATILMLAISGVVLSGVFSRYILKEPFYATDRWATYLFVILSFWGIQMASGYYEHITVGVVKNWLSPFWQAIFSALASLVSSAFLAYLAWAAYKFVKFLYESGEKDLVLEIPLWVIYGFFVLAASVSAVRYFIGTFLWIAVARGRLTPEAFQKKSLV
ncbi:MAG: TRAP transporter small permease subunit [Bacteroidia bacterium]|nr:TRAP transporter small permease subunit [Bacteroidia bacterium]MCX7764113.1 TRAP transporter small permease subunit [Bacteroidia bacterium]MDW8057489.1 TRAP transporter small permease subunit [Bacteroidia bacterium]